MEHSLVEHAPLLARALESHNTWLETMIPTQYPLWYGAPAMWQAPPPLPYWGYVPPQPMFAYPAPVGALAAPSLYTSAAALPAQVTYSTASAAVASSSSSAASSEPSAPAPVVKNTKVLALFDVDGTLTAPRLVRRPRALGLFCCAAWTDVRGSASSLA